MGIGFQQSCFTIPDFYDGFTNLQAVKKPGRKRLIKERSARMTEIIEEARLWTLGATIPFPIISDEPTFKAEMHNIATATLGPRIGERKIRGATLIIYILEGC